MAVVAGQLDLLDLLIPEPEKVDLSKLIGFTMAVTDPDELDRIALAWTTAYHELPWHEWRMFPGWRESHTGTNGLNGPHPSFTYAADLRTCRHERRCVAEREADPCECLGGYLYRIYCSACDRWTGVHDAENGAAEDYLDHCWSGWWDLPVIESSQNPKGGYIFPLPEDYPAQWQCPGAPIRECRGRTRYGTRHVPGGSPYGGYKTAVLRDCKGTHRND